jgi:hypothetical protein
VRVPTYDGGRARLELHARHQFGLKVIV